MRATKTTALALLVLLSLAFLLQGDLPTVPTGTWTPANSLAEGRSASAAVLLQDGRILFTGGTGASGPLATAELFNTDGSFSPAASMQNPRANHTAVVLQDGRVLVAGGTTSGGGITSAAEIYDPASNSWTPVAGGMTAPRSNHTASLLADGTVLIAGGQSTSSALNSLEIFDPSTGVFTAAPDVLSSARQSHAAAVLQNGQVLLVGGSDGTNALASSDLFDPESELINPGPALSTPRQGPSATTTLDGRVLVAGGNNGTSDLASAEIFQAGAGFSVTGSMAATRSGHRAFLLPNNNGVLIVGGSSAGAPLASAELFYPWTGTFNTTGGMAVARIAAAGAPLKQNGVLLVAGGTDGANQLASGELYGFATVKTDKTDYQPGETVTITGMGWQPGETVTLTFLESPNIDTHPPLTAVADANGNISNTQFSPDSHDLEVLFYLTATGSVSQAQTVFTDGTASNGDGNMVVSPTIVAAGSTGNTLTFTFTSTNGKDFNAGSQATILVPAGWTAPTSGNVAVAPVSCSAATLGTITGTGPWTIPINMTCPGGDSFTATFNGVTAPSTAGSNQFTTKTKQSGGTLTNISVQPTVTVQAASKLAFLQQPTNTQEGSSITPGVTVQVQDANGDLVNTSTASITIAISNNPGGGTLAGTVTAAAVNGVATFNNLAINKTGTGYMLSASSAGLTTATSSAFNITPGTPTHLVFGQQPTNAQAGASITPAVTVQVLDANNNLVSTGTGSTASITMAIGTNPSGGTLSGTTTVAASGGIATFSNLSINKLGNGYTLTAASSGLTGTASSAFNITAGTVSAGASTVSSNPASVTADGSTTSTITVTLLDASSNPVSGKTVTLAKSGGSSTISVASGSSSASGVVTFTVKDTVAEATTYTATDTTDSITMTQTAIVTFTAGAVSAGTSILSANPTSVVADGASTSTITVTLKDANNNPVSGKTVSLAAGSGSSTITTVSGTTSASGQASFTVKDTVVESVTYTAKDTTDNITVTPTATVNFTVGPANPGTSTVTANPTSVPADGSTTSTITVTLKDASSRPVSGKTVTLSQGTGTSTISAASGPSNASGVVTFTVKDTKAEAVTYTATDTTDPVTITQTATVTFSNPAPTTTSISPSSKNTGDAGFTLTVNGTNFVSASTVNFSGSGRTTTFVSATQVSASITPADVATAGSFPITVTNSAPGGGTSNAQTLTVNPKLAFTSAAFANLTGVCSPQINAQIQNANGTAATLTAPTTLSLSSNSATGKFFSDAACATPVPGNSITIAAGSSTATFFYNDTTVGSPVITVASTGLTSIQQAETITSLRFGSTAFTILVGQCSGALSVQSANTSGGNPTSLTQATTINLSTSSAGGKFYSDATCTTQITSTTISPSIDAGHDSPNFFYKDAVAGNPTLTASAGTASATQAETINKATTAFSNLTASQTIPYGKASINLSGTIAAGSTFPPTTETVGITINGVTVQAAIGANGAFSASFDSHAIPASASAYSITYSYAGDANFTSATNTATTLKVNPATTSTALVSSLNPSFSGQSATFTATVTNTSGTPATPRGTVQFLDNGSPVGSPQPVNAQGTATLTSTSLSVGAHPITASYVNSDGDFSNSTSSSVNQTVNSATTTTTVMSSLNPSAFGLSVTFTATVTSPGGTPTGSVQFSIDGLAFGGSAALISGMATSGAISSLGAGSHAISAVYSGDGNFLTSTGGITQNVNQVAPSVSDSGPSSSTFGQSVTLSVTVAPPNGGTPTGTVTFSFVQNSTTYFVCSDGTVSSAPCTVNVIPVGGNYVASVTTSKLPPGTDGVMATYSGDTNFQGEPANNVSVTVSQADSATTLMKSQDPSPYGTSVDLTVKVKDNTANSTGVPTGTVTLSFNLDPIDPNAHVYYICADGTISTTACVDPNQISLDQTATATVTTSNLPAGLTASTFAYVINASYSGDTNFKASGPVGLNQTVNQRPITVTAATYTKTYDGTTSSAGVPTITAGTLANGDTANFTESFDNRNAGMGKTLTPAGSVKDGFGGNNYAVTYTPVSTGVINALAITVTAVTDKKTYDGTTSSAKSPMIAPAPIIPDTSGFTQTFDTRNVGMGKTLTASGSVNDGNSGKNYAVTFVKNTYGEIDAAALTITAVTNTKAYDSTASAVATPAVTGVQPGDTVTGVTETYDTKNVGTGKTLSVATYTVTDGNSGHNYTVTTATNATGVITQAPLTITAVTNTKTYDATIFAGATPAVSGLQGTDTVTGLSETYDTPTAGAGKTLSVATYTVNDGNGGGNYAVVPVADHTGVILQATPVVVDNGPPASIFGQPVTLSVTVTPPSGGAPMGTVTFTFTQSSTLYYVCADGSISTTLCTVPVTLSNGNYVASVTTSNLPTAADNVMATYSGDTNFQGEPANSVSVTVSQADTDTTLMKSPDPSVYGDSVNLTVKVKDNTANSTGVPTGTVTLSFKLDPNDPNAQVYYICGDGTISTTACGAQDQIGLSADSTDTQGQTAMATVTTPNLPAGLPASSFAYAINASYAGDTNFKASGPVGLNQTVNQRPITVTAATDTKTYDGGTSSAGAPTITAGTLVNGDTSNFTESFDNRNAGTGKALKPAGTVKDGFGGNNYAVTFTSVSTGVINPLAITVKAVADKKIYDGTTSSKGMPAITPALISPDASGFTQTFDNKNVGTGKTLTASGSVNDGNSGNNYAVTFVKNTYGEIDPAALTITAVTNTKVYDSTTSAVATPAVTGLQPGDTVSATESYDTKNVGTGKTLSVATYTVTDGNSGHNYTVTTATNATGVITQAPLTITAVTNTKTYDATIFAGATPAVSGLQGTDTVTGLSETYDTPTAGAGKTLSVATYTVNDGNGGGNYAVVPVADHTGVILQATPVVVDNGPPASIFGQPVTLSVTVTPPSGGAPMGTVTFTFTQSSTLYYVCADGSISTTLCTVPVTLSNGNYVASVTTSNLPTAADNVMATYSGDTNFQGEPANSVSVTVSQADTDTTLMKSPDPSVYGDSVNLTVKVKDNTANSTGVPTGTVTLSFKLDPNDPNAQVYYICGDGTISTTACVDPNQISLDQVATATVTTTNLPAGLTAATFAYAINASYSGDTNFKASGPVGLNQTVNQRPITVTAATDTKTYDGGTSSAGAPTITAGTLVNGDTSNFTESFDNRNAGTGKALKPAGTVKDGFGGNNYAVTFTSVSTGVINPLAITVTAVADAKIYDGSTTSAGGPAIAPPLVNGDTPNFTQAFNNKNAGMNKTLTPSGSVNDGNSGNNYAVTFKNASGAVNQRALIVSATGVSKQYDGLTTATVTLSDNRVAGDVFTDSYTSANFADKNVGNNKAVSVGGISISGVDAGNYTFNATAATTANITPAPLTITANNKSRLYGAANPPFDSSYSGFVNGEAPAVLTGTQVCTTPATTASPFGTYSITCLGQTSSNYGIHYVPGQLTVNPAPLTITASSPAMIYGGPVPPITAGYGGFVNGDTSSNLTTQPTCATLATSSSPVAAYASGCAGAMDINYGITYVPGVVTLIQATTTSSLTSSLNPSNWMQVVMFTATVAPQYSQTPTGNVSFYNVPSGTACSSVGSLTPFDTETLSAGSASTSTPTLPTGTDTILACYSGDTNFISSSGSVSQTVIPAPIASLSPASVSFGNQQAGTTSGAQSVVVSNPNGTAPLSISNIGIAGTNASSFIQTNNCGSVVVGGSCIVNVKFSPADTGAATAILTVTDNNENASGSQQSLPLTGAGTSSISSVGSLSTYAIFATANGCSSINGSGGITVDSFNSSQGSYALSHQNSGGNVGTDGNVSLSGSNTIIYGTAYSPVSGSGNCSTKSITGYSTSGGAKATGGEIPLSQPVTYPAPPAPNPAPPTSNQAISGSCGSIPGCTNSGSKTVTLTPGQYGNVTLSGGTTGHVTAGTYNMSGLTLSGNSALVVDSVPVIVNLGGNSLSNGNAVLDLTGGSMSNSSGVPSNLQFYYAGSRPIKLSGGAGSYAVVYAPNSPINVSGGSHFYGSIVGSTVNDSGGTAIHYDASLSSINAGSYMWFNSAGLNVLGLPSTGSVKLYVTNASISFTANGTKYTLPVPTAVITFSSTATAASTTWDATNNRWTTLVPTSMVNGNTAIHTFLDGLAFQVPSNFPGGIQNVTWTAAFSTDSPGISFQWQWGAAVYNSFSTTYSSLGVNPVDNADPAGTPEAYKSYLVFGATGAGPTGLYVGTAGVVPTIAPVSVSPSNLDFSSGGTVSEAVGTTSKSMTAVLTNNQSGPLTIASTGIQITGTNPGDFAQTNNCPISPNTLAGGGTCTFTVTFTPTATGKRTAKIALNDDANNSPQTLFLKGTGQ